MPDEFFSRKFDISPEDSVSGLKSEISELYLWCKDNLEILIQQEEFEENKWGGLSILLNRIENHLENLRFEGKPLASVNKELGERLLKIYRRLNYLKACTHRDNNLKLPDEFIDDRNNIKLEDLLNNIKLEELLNTLRINKRIEQ